MPQPAANAKAAERLIGAYRAAHDALVAEYTAAMAEKRSPRRIARLRELIRTNEATVEALETVARQWWSATLPEIHAAGAAQAASVGGSSFAWTAPHTEAVTEFVTRTWDDVAERLRSMSTETRRVLRRSIEEATRATLLEGRTATQAAREVAAEATRAGLWSVEYSNGARHSIADYMDSVVRTTTGEAYNRGSVVQAREDGFTHLEYFDGPDCGVDGHNVPPLANGLIVPIDEVVYLSHPRCQRAVMPALEGQTLTPDGLDLAEAPAETPAVSAGRAPREPRTPRAGAPAATLDDMAARIASDAAGAADGVQTLLEDAVAGVGELVGTENRVKGAARIAEKLNERLAGLPVRSIDAAAAAAEVPDALRFTAQFDDALYAAGAERVLARLTSLGYDVEVRNSWRNPTGYRGINVRVRTPDGRLFELQFHTAESFAAKEATHALYEQQRVIEAGSPAWIGLRDRQATVFALVPVPPGAGSVGP